MNQAEQDRAERIELAHEPDFALGRLTVMPSRRELVCQDGRSEVLQHRVMQVLIALVRANGRIVTRDELTQACWDGRVVGEDAINRVISQLRKVAEGTGAGSFRIETIPKIGYRLIAEHGGITAPAHETRPARHAARPNRRAFALGAAAALLAAAGGGALLYRRSAGQTPSPEVDRLMAQAWQEWNQGSREGLSQAIGLYRHVTEIAPGYADSWGLLGCCYADAAHGAPQAEREALRERSIAAGRQALRLDSHNAYGRAAIAFARPIRGNWLAMEQGFRQALRDQPDKVLVRHGLGVSLARVGRLAEAAAEFDQLPDYRLVPGHFGGYIMTLWAAGRIEDAERLAADAAHIYPSHPALWFPRFDMAMYGGRTSAAIAQLQDAANLPPSLGQADLDQLAAVARAIASRDPAAIDAVMAVQMRLARLDAGAAADAMQYASALGRLDEAFAVAEAFFFSRGFTVPDGQDRAGAEPDLASRNTVSLFLPPMRAMRADPRFGGLVREIGLERYWREAGVQPDYRRA